MAEIHVPEVMAEAKSSTSRGEDPVELVGEASYSGADGSTSPGIVPSATAAESPSFLTWMWIQILTACSGVWGARGDGLSEPKVLELASGAQQTQEDSESEVSSRIAASKSTWSEVPGRDIHHSVSVPCPSDLSDWEELKASAPKFFRDWEDRLEFGRLIAEGGQAQIFEAKLKRSDRDLVLKVFKLDAGVSLADLKQHWPRSMETRNWSLFSKGPGFVFEDSVANIVGYRCWIFGATWFKNGRFAFLMERYWGDLRTLIDIKVKDNTHLLKFGLLSQPLFSFSESIRIMLEIAFGMLGLHEEGVLHRDLKAANVLIKVEGDDSKHFCVADYECAMFVQGTGFWRAPEVLQELLKKEDRNGEIWTEKVDVYSFGMTCYEILTGQRPFDGYDKKKWGDVIKGERPCLPNFVFPELRELVEACWHVQPSRRPSFDIISRELHSIHRKYSYEEAFRGAYWIWD